MIPLVQDCLLGLIPKGINRKGYKMPQPCGYHRADRFRLRKTVDYEAHGLRSPVMFVYSSELRPTFGLLSR